MKKKIIAAGHICLDITPIFPSGREYRNISQILEPGKLIRMEHANVNTGGSVANTGLALKRLGVDVQLMGKIGDDAFGSIVREIAAKYDADGLIVDPDSSTSYSVVLAVPGIDRVFLHNPGANDTFTNSDIPDNSLEDATLFHFGYPPIMKRIYENDGVELQRIFMRMKEKGIATSLDMAAVDPDSDAGHADWHKILCNVLPYTDFFLPSFEELCFMLDRPLYDKLASAGGDMVSAISMEEHVAPLARKCIDMGCCVAVIKCGTAGMYYLTSSEESMKQVGSRLELDTALWADKHGVQPCFVADRVLSGTGAGDASIAAYLLTLCEGFSPEMCAALAAAQGACAVTEYDALSGLRPLHELLDRINSGWQTM